MRTSFLIVAAIVFSTAPAWAGMSRGLTLTTSESSEPAPAAQQPTPPPARPLPPLPAPLAQPAPQAPTLPTPDSPPHTVGSTNAPATLGTAATASKPATPPLLLPQQQAPAQASRIAPTQGQQQLPQALPPLPIQPQVQQPLQTQQPQVSQPVQPSPHLQQAPSTRSAKAQVIVDAKKSRGSHDRIRDHSDFPSTIRREMRRFRFGFGGLW